MNPIDEFVAEYVSPSLIQAGFGKRGRTFTMESPNGDRAVVEVEAFAPRGRRYAVGVSVGVALPAMAAWLRRVTEPGLVAGQASDLWHDSVLVPGRVAGEEPERGEDGGVLLPDYWDFSIDDLKGREQRGRDLAFLLAADVVPRLVSLLDRRELLKIVRSSSASTLGTGPLYAELILVADSGQVDDLVRALSPIQAAGDPIGFAEWAVAWAKHRAATTSQTH